MELLDDGHQILLQVLGADALRVRLLGFNANPGCRCIFRSPWVAEELEKVSDASPMNHARIRMLIQDITYWAAECERLDSPVYEATNRGGGLTGTPEATVAA